MITPLPPEIDLLLICARTHLEAAHIDALYRRLRDDLDWDHVIRLARQHTVLPLLYRHLKTIDTQAVPQTVWDKLRRLFQTNLRRNLSMTAELLKLLRILEAHGIPAIPYKGPTLAAAVYGDLALRQFGDLDILVHRQDVLDVKNLLLRRGYQGLFSLPPAQEDVYLETGCELSFHHPEKSIWVDLHWHIVRKFYALPLPLAPLWDRRQPVHLNGQQILSLAPEDLMLILCIHNGKHHWDRLGWICDVAELLRQCPEMDWEPLMDQAVRIGAARLLWLGLYLARDLLGATLPGPVKQRIEADPAVPPLAAQLSNHLFQPPHDSSNPWPRFFTTLKMRERWRDRIQYGYGQLTAVSIDDFTFLSLPPKLSGLYYGLRPVRLFKYLTKIKSIK